ncbi:MAG TPA: cation diffusion facilitator family transporter [Candidatus Saccharimonadia bacterium]|nr:cation diffusion facilitator family transporter [Candidatus Saccharimonadia bacterium]
MAHVRKPLISATLLNTGICFIEGLAGYQANSLSLLMDSVHNLSDELALVCLCLAYLLPLRLSRHLQRSANLLNSVGLIIVSGLLVWQAIARLLSPTAVLGYFPLVVGVLAALGNGGVAWLLRGVRDQNPAIRLAYVHNLGDVYVSLAPVAAGLLVTVSGQSLFDPLMALLVALWLIGATVQEIRSTGEALLWPEDAVCRHAPEEVYETV